jgi:hypothetical protein
MKENLFNINYINNQKIIQYHFCHFLQSNGYLTLDYYLVFK